jgi:CxxC motif-containing protein (DUF1111 family)
LLAGLIALVLVVSCSSGSSSTGEGEPPAGSSARPPSDQLARSGGDGTVDDVSANAFALSMPSLTPEQRRAFSVGNNFFNDNWVTAPASTEGRDGLGPMFNAQSCSSCHEHDGPARLPERDGDPELGLLLRLSVPGPDGTPVDDPNYGGQLQDHAINGVPAEGHVRITTTDIEGTYADGTTYTLAKPSYEIVDPAFGPLPDDLMISPRLAPAVFGLGLLESIPESTIVAKADPDDADGDGISGRVNRVTDERTGQTVLGRFGWKANVPTIEQQTGAAFNGDIGITSSIFPTQDCTAVQTACAAAPTGGEPELDENKLQRVTFYTRTLAVPARRAVDDPTNVEGEQLFGQLGCASCHTPEVSTGPSDLEPLANQVIRPYTDLLLHDMGDQLADGRPDGEATGNEWRTAPLWGIGLTETVSRHTRFLHDGRARNLTEAILWHGGEAAPAQERFRGLDADQREALLAFLGSL